jgi:hypothetical protein
MWRGSFPTGALSNNMLLKPRKIDPAIILYKFLKVPQKKMKIAPLARDYTTPGSSRIT